MKHHIDELRRLCAHHPQRPAPYLLRTRFERHLYGVLVGFSDLVFGMRPSGITEHHVRELLSRSDTRNREREVNAVLRVSRIFHRFTYLCDTSNWSDDGQDPRVEMCRDEILRLCDFVESLAVRPRKEKSFSAQSAKT